MPMQDVLQQILFLPHMNSKKCSKSLLSWAIKPTNSIMPSLCFWKLCAFNVEKEKTVMRPHCAWAQTHY